MELPTRMSERFTLAELIGRGGCSSVFRARDELLDRDVAVKVFPVTDDPRVAREVHLLASLDHPALVPVYDLGEVDGRAYVVMALFEGGNLADRLSAGGPLPLGHALLAGAAVADALAHVHRAGVLHRDVIPRNVLFDADGRAHLSDFGVALVADAPRITDTGIVVGSAPYLAPEQVRGDAVGPRADVYSLGLLTIEALTGRPAYEGTPLEAAQARLERPPRVPRGLPDDVATLIRAMTADDPDARPDAEDVCRRMRQTALAQEVAADDPRRDPVGAGGAAAAPAAGPATALFPRDARSGRRAGRGTLVLGAATLSIMLASGVVIASAGPVGSIAATTPPEAGLAAPTAVAPAPIAPFAVADGGAADSEDADDARSVSDGSGSDGDGDRGPVVAARASRAAAAGSDTDAADRPDAGPAEPARPAQVDPEPGSASDDPPASSATPSTSSSGTTTSPHPTTSSTSSTSPTSSTSDREDDDDRGGHDGPRDRDRDRPRDARPTPSTTTPSTPTTTTTTTTRSGDDDEGTSDRNGRGGRSERTGLLGALGDPVGGLLGR